MLLLNAIRSSIRDSKKKDKKRRAGEIAQLYKVNSDLERFEWELLELEQKILDLKRQQKTRRGERFHIVFLCYRPSVWDALRSVYEAFKADPDFLVTIAACKYKHKGTYIDEGAYSFFKQQYDAVIDCYDQETKRWKNLKDLEPDIVFYQTPYEKRFPDMYAMSDVARFAYIAYIHYAISGVQPEINTTYRWCLAFNCSLNFVETRSRGFLVDEFLARARTPRIRYTYFTGHPKLDGISQYQIKEDEVAWKNFPHKNLYRIMWTPRWSLKEGDCFFPDFKDLLFEYIKEDEGTELVFRPHPIAFREYVIQKAITEAELAEYLARYETAERAVIDTSKSYMSTFLASDVLVTDYTSLMAEYIFTGKPLIYCHKRNIFNEDFSSLANGFYWVENWKELEETLQMLRSGNDPLARQRQEIAESVFYRPRGGSGQLIKQLVRQFLHKGPFALNKEKIVSR